MGKIQLFVENKMLGGYSLAVRDDWSFKIKRVSISEIEKQAYENKFGEQILTYTEFFKWWQVFVKENNSKIRL
jgi:hypothetical protein